MRAGERRPRWGRVWMVGAALWSLPLGGLMAQQQGAAPPPVASTPAPPPKRPAEVQVAPAAAKAIRANPLVQRLGTLGGEAQWRGGAKGAGQWRKDALGAGRAIPVSFPIPRGTLKGYAVEDGSRLWLASGMLREQGAILRLGDLLPLLKAVGIDDRKAALAVTQVRLSSGAPPSYTLVFRTGALHPHRAALAQAEKAGRVAYSLTTGQVTVLGALVVADAKGDLAVKRVSAEGYNTVRLRQSLQRAGCEPLEQALRTGKAGAVLAQAETALGTPSVSQACAARFLAVSGVPGAAPRLRKALAQARVTWPAELVEALAWVEPDPSKANLDAAAALIRRSGASGARGVCEGAPIAWTDGLLARSDLSPGARAVLDRCAWQ